MNTFHIFLPLILAGTLLYHRSSFWIWLATCAAYLIFITFLFPINAVMMVILWLTIVGGLCIFGIPSLRQKLITSMIFDFAKKQLPTITSSEYEALKAGTITWDGELFSGKPDWNKLFAYEAAKLSEEEQKFMDGPVHTLANHNFSTWDMWHKDLTYNPELTKKAQKLALFGMNLPEKYGGKNFSVTAIWQIILYLENSLGPLGTWIGISNSIGAGELIERFGSEEQKDKYLPRLAKGDEIPCFALTSPIAGSDATAIEDHGIVCQGTFEGKETLGIRLNFEKRYITLGCDATLISLAFKLYDPDHLIGSKEDVGLTVALVPSKLSGITKGRRHYPTGLPFPNGPLQGKDVFIPLEYVLGGQAGLGKGWTALTQSLATGRATSLPTLAISAMKENFYATTLYATIRKQFGLTIGSFESVQEKLAELAGYTYMSDALRLLTFSQIAAKERPAIPAALSKYITTELARKCTILAMDIQAGKAVMHGPNNLAAQSYQSAPVAITVEGSNTMTRGLIIFGQGAIRCHPYILTLMAALEQEDKETFDKNIVKAINFTLSNHVRSLFLALTQGFFTKLPPHDHSMTPYLRKMNRISASFAFLADMAMITLGGKLKRMESLSGRFADIFTMLYMGSACIKHFKDQEYAKELLPVVEWSLQWALYEAEQKLSEIIDNTKNPWIRFWYRMFVFPLGRKYKKPNDHLSLGVAKATQSSRSLRENLASGIHFEPLLFLEETLELAEKTEDIHHRLRNALKTGTLKGYTYKERIADAFDKKIITPEEENLLQDYYTKLMKVINVDDFSLEELREQK
ncbi:MAG: acyl-CoA dehydrogenase [Alphaproteobacteria bacterium]|nr:acyl-CoA dehydrogenase [Alphaproteobacteria bacterium]